MQQEGLLIIAIVFQAKPPKGSQAVAHFAIIHYAGTVRYNADQWLDKNKVAISVVYRCFELEVVELRRRKVFFFPLDVILGSAERLCSCRPEDF